MDWKNIELEDITEGEALSRVFVLEQQMEEWEELGYSPKDVSRIMTQIFIHDTGNITELLHKELRTVLLHAALMRERLFDIEEAVRRK